MSASHEESIRKLELLCATLEQAIQLLEAAVPDLGARGDDLVGAERELRGNAAALADETHSLETDLEAWEGQAGSAASELCEAASQALETRLPRLEARAAEAEVHLHQALADLATHLASDSEELQTLGFEPLALSLGADRSNVQRWATDSYAAIGVLAESLEVATAAGRSDLEDGTDDLRGGAVAVDAGPWSSQLQQCLLELDENLLDSIDTRCDGYELAARIGQCLELVQAMVASERQAAQDRGEEAAVSLQGEYRQVADAVAAASDALLAVEREHAQSECDAGSTDAVVAPIAELRPRIEAASEDCVRIRAVLDVMGAS
ncbi:MAG: hypothetical protein ABW221_23520 [Vicinamibacteria bacterium]